MYMYYETNWTDNFLDTELVLAELSEVVGSGFGNSRTRFSYLYFFLKNKERKEMRLRKRKKVDKSHRNGNSVLRSPGIFHFFLLTPVAVTVHLVHSDMFPVQP